MDQQIMKYAVKIIIIFLILPIHEYAHAWTAHKMGDDTAFYKGRLTINPLSHIDIFGALCLLITGFGWAKPVPVNPLRFKNQRKGMAITAAAGPISNLLVAFIAMVVIRFAESTDFYIRSAIDYATERNSVFVIFIMLQYFIYINIGLAIFNLIPIPPLDGSKILGYFTSSKFDRFIYENQQFISIAFLLIIVTGVLGGPLSWMAENVYDIMYYLTNWIPKLIN